MSLFNKRLPTPKSELFAALDVGTSKVCCAIARAVGNKYQDQAPLKVSGIGYQLSKGLRGGNIIDLDALEDSILNAVHAAEQSAGQNINSVYIAVPGRWAQSHRLKVELQLSNYPVDESHLKRLLTLNRDASIAADQHILHVLPISYAIDDVQGIRDPRGMIGQRLSVTLHVVSAPIGMIRNLTSCIGRCHLDIAGFIVSPYASGLATLVDDEMELGVTLIDMGAGQTTISTFYEGNLTSLTTIPIGGANITNDIARGLATPLAQAERLKTLYGTLIQSSTDDRENIMVSQMGESIQNYSHQIPKGMLVHIIRSRVEEIFEWIAKKVQTHEIDPVAFQRIVLTGGVSQLQGIREMATQYFSKQVRLGTPNGLSGTIDLIKDPSFATCSGVLQYAFEDFESQQASALSINQSSMLKKLNSWIKQNF
ncbi:MAG: cell division protein FtsA [Candidatus Paracaedibacteraceae bacterium]|nr:cell division protein FtsA [Candidatus Paracaedibacteraceae bacterium]